MTEREKQLNGDWFDECGDQSRRHFRRQCGRRLRRGRDKVFWR